jgi:uncharacterized RDD family membrane protein YckC
LGPLDRDLLADLQRIEKIERKEAKAEMRAARHADTGTGVGAVARLSAAAVDAVLLGAVSAAVVWVTLRWTELPLERAAVLPVVLPTSAFLVLVGVGYLLMFTAAGGQTLGKMALGIRVVGESSDADGAAALTIGQAVSRACLTIPSVLALGAGFVPALIGEERAVHDRLAHTRVVRA